MGGINIWQLLIVATIIVVLFGTKKLRGAGGDLGEAIRGFKDAIKDQETTSNLNIRNTELQNGSNDKREIDF
ncbi:twin-arginine translocase TatA/TatE family subunit [Vibrio maritimus]|uniref:twin-arginine translocase TatA/TatE family subunit n=1 Tax=Vibrio maritimus TaxID=990268 RepID=UPI001F2065FD|nr:twin-arginine translocase TatA/TatE family subunit [Vibrio maritimus]